MSSIPVGGATFSASESQGAPAQGSLRARIDAMASMPTARVDAPMQRPQVRPSQVRAVLSQAALHMHLPIATTAQMASGPEYERLRATLKQIKSDSKEGLGAVGAQLAMESESTRVVEHVNASVRSVQRAFGVLADTLEDEVGNLRAADAQQWEQLKVHATQFHEVEELKTELERTRADLRATQGALATFKADEHASVARKVEELVNELSEQRDQIAAMQKAHASERNRLVEEVASLRRWRTDVAAPFIETAGRAVANHEQQLERTVPALQKLVEEIDGRTAKHIPELLHATDASNRRQQLLEEEGARTAAQLARLGEAHTESQARIEERLRLFRDESRTESESHELRLRQAASELDAQADAIRTLGTETAKARVEAREEADTLANAVRNVQTAVSEATEKHERSEASLRSDVRELKEASEAASSREAQTLEGVLNLKTQQNQVSAWMEHVQRELGTTKTEGARSSELLRDLSTELEAAKAARHQWREELSVVDSKLSDALRVIDAHQAERQKLREMGSSMEVFKREVRATFEATQHAHNRLRELVDERRSHSANTTGLVATGGERDRERGLWTSNGAAAARELEAAQHAQRRAESTSDSTYRGLGLGQTGTEGLSSASDLRTSRFALLEQPAAPQDPPRPKFAWDADFEPPASRVPQTGPPARSPPLSHGTGPSAFTPSLWKTPGAGRASRFGDLEGGTSSSRLSLGGLGQPVASPAITRQEPRRNEF